MKLQLSLRNSKQVNNEATSNSYNMATRALADLSPEGAKRPRAINQSSARGAML